MCEVIEVDFQKKKKVYKLTYTDAIKKQKFRELEDLAFKIKLILPVIAGRSRSTLEHMKVLDIMTKNMWEHIVGEE